MAFNPWGGETNIQVREMWRQMKSNAVRRVPFNETFLPEMLTYDMYSLYLFEIACEDQPKMHV